MSESVCKKGREKKNDIRIESCFVQNLEEELIVERWKNCAMLKVRLLVVRSLIYPAQMKWVRYTPVLIDNLYFSLLT